MSFVLRPRFAVSSLTAAVLFLAPLAVTAASAAMLAPGDVVALGLENMSPPNALLHVVPATGALDTIVARPPLGQPLDLVVRVDGIVLVADVALGLVAVSPVSGVATVLAGPAAFGGSGPSTLAYAPGGDLLLAGAGGVWRIPAGQSSLQALSGPGILVDPRGIADDGAGGVWISDQGNTYPSGGQIVHVSAGGGQAALVTSCASYTFPVVPLEVRRGTDGFLYVVSGPYGGPTNYNNAGIFRVDPATGVATVWRTTKFIRGFELAPTGAWVLCGQDISHDPYGGILGGPGGQFYTNARGPIALVPAGVTPVRARTWGSLKATYR